MLRGGGPHPGPQGARISEDWTRVAALDSEAESGASVLELYTVQGSREEGRACQPEEARKAPRCGLSFQRSYKSDL